LSNHGDPRHRLPLIKRHHHPAPISSTFYPKMTSNRTSYPPKILTNFINGTFATTSSNRTLPITNPNDGSTITNVVLSNVKDVDVAVQAAQKAFDIWSKTNIKTRVLKLMKLHQLMTDNLDELAELVVKEHGKNIIEAKASITKGMETLEVFIPFRMGL
jgi:malonate-semialdehyde dehydrogenase (acetylating)/methylmalonate-semialdehyde dehydrogenase